MTDSYPPSVRLSQAFEDSRGGGGVTRRIFIKRTGGATVATFVAWNALQLNSRGKHPPGHESHCSVHAGSTCEWITKIAVTFDAAIAKEDVPAHPTYPKSGRLFTGKLTITKKTCLTGTEELGPYDVHSGGYTEHPDISGDDDSCCPANAATTTDAHQTEGNVWGFAVAIPENTDRTDIEIHEPGASTGCIVFDNVADWKAFRHLMNDGNDNKQACPDPPGPPQQVPTSIVYSVDPPPSGNTPGLPGFE